VRCLGLRLSGDAIEETDEKGCIISDDTFLVLLNAYHEALPFVLPAHKPGVRWEHILDTSNSNGDKGVRILKAGERYDLEARSIAVLRLQSVLPRSVEVTRSSHARPRIPKGMRAVRGFKTRDR
jgi:glycogen operon protein